MARKTRVEGYLNIAAAGEGKVGLAGVVEIDDGAVAIGCEGESGNKRNPARPAGEAAIAVQGLAVGFFAFHLDVVTPFGSIALLGAEELVEDGFLDLIGEAGLAREAKKLSVELEPGDGDAGFADVVDRGKIVSGMKEFEIARGASGVKTAEADVLPRVFGGLEEFVLAGGAIKLQGAVEAREHFISLAVTHFIDPFAGQ